MDFKGNLEGLQVHCPECGALQLWHWSERQFWGLEELMSAAREVCSHGEAAYQEYVEDRNFHLSLEREEE